jgi:possible cheW protein
MIKKQGGGRLMDTYVVFKINGQKYCVNILTIKEICSNKETTFLPNTPSFIEGIINLRGEVLSIINLSKKLGIVSSTPFQEQKILVVIIDELLLGFLVDEVIGIIHTPSENIDNKPKMLENEENFISGIIKSGDEMIISIDLEHILNKEELSSVEQLNKEQAI